MALESVTANAGKNQLRGDGEEDDELSIPKVSDNEVSIIASAIRRDLEREGSEWVVLFDTDGGDNHGLTKIALCTADHIVSPVNASMGAENDILRMKLQFDFLQRMYNRGLAGAGVDLVVFNQLDSRLNEPMSLIGSPFTPLAKVQEVMKKIHSLFMDKESESKWQVKYADVLRAFRTSTVAECFTAVRTGGVEFMKAAENPWHCNAGNAQEDIDLLTEKILRIIDTRRKAEAGMSLNRALFA
jgi:hypothetical protein